MSDPFGGLDPRIFSEVPFFRELMKLMQWRGGPVNWELASQTAAAIAGRDDVAVPPQEVSAFGEAVRVAELWLDGVTELPAVEGSARPLTQAEWTRLATSPDGLGVYVEPVAEGMAAALAGQLPDGLAEAGGPMMAQTMGAMGAMLYGVQTGAVAGNLASQILATYDLGVPTVDPRTIGPVGGTAAKFAGDYDFDPMELRHWLALRETAHRRQFAGVPWLRDHVAGLIRRFAADADFRPDALLEQFGGFGFDPSDADALEAALRQPDAFRLEPTTAQKATLDRLQALVAFTEGWVSTVVVAGAHDRLTALPRIDEAMRRRRATQGPGEQFLQQLVGLDLRPADLRQGQAFCDAVVAARGQAGLDRVWVSPDRLPSPEELAEPSRWLVRMAGLELSPGS